MPEGTYNAKAILKHAETTLKGIDVKKYRRNTVRTFGPSGKEKQRDMQILRPKLYILAQNEEREDFAKSNFTQKGGLIEVEIINRGDSASYNTVLKLLVRESNSSQISEIDRRILPQVPAWRSLTESFQLDQELYPNGLSWYQAVAFDPLFDPLPTSLIASLVPNFNLLRNTGFGLSQFRSNVQPSPITWQEHLLNNGLNEVSASQTWQVPTDIVNLTSSDIFFSGAESNKSKLLSNYFSTTNNTPLISQLKQVVDLHSLTQPFLQAKEDLMLHASGLARIDQAGEARIGLELRNANNQQISLERVTVVRSTQSTPWVSWSLSKPLSSSVKQATLQLIADRRNTPPLGAIHFDNVRLYVTHRQVFASNNI